MQESGILSDDPLAARLHQHLQSLELERPHFKRVTLTECSIYK